jgi:hypothetical protein
MSRSASRERVTTYAPWKLILFYHAISWSGENLEISPRILVSLFATFVKSYTWQLIGELFFRIAHKPNSRIISEWKAARSESTKLILNNCSPHFITFLARRLFFDFIHFRIYYTIIFLAQQTFNK